MARIESGEISFSMEEISLNLLTEELVTLCNPLAKKGEVELLNYVPLLKEQYVFADRVRLKQILLNLISNAIKYNKPNGTVKIEATGDKKDGIRISISDTGIGISKDQIENMFQPFNRLGFEKMGIEGTGIGLTITKKLVEQMNGTIEVESQPEEGSVFSVTFPVGKSQSIVEVIPQATTDLKHASSEKQWVVLYVEDNPANLSLVRHIFYRRPDVLLLTAPDAKLGLELAQAHQPDLILMDINLPGMDGLTAFQRLREMEETQQIPVVAISANAMPRDIKKALSLGFADYITKPLSVVEFHQMLEEQLKSDLKRR